MRSTQQHNPMVDLVHYQLEASMHLAEAVFSGTEKIDRAMLDVTHQAVDGQLKLARAVTDMRDPARMAELQVALASRPEKAMHCQQQIMSALVEIQAEFGRSIRVYLERFAQNAAQQSGQSVEQAETIASMGHMPGAPLNPFTGMLSVWEEAFREAGKLASQNMMAASSSLETATAAAREMTSRGTEMPAPNGHHRQTSGRPKRQTGTRRKP
jgi:Phasin protein